MKLFILRHGRAESLKSTDFDRELTAEGIAEIQSLGARFKQEQRVFNRVFTSPYKRTLQTFRHLKNHAGFDSESTEEYKLTPDSTAENALDILRHLEHDMTVLLIGHQPVVSALTALLTDKQEDHYHYYPMQPGSVAELDVYATEPGCAVLKSILHPPYYKAT